MASFMKEYEHLQIQLKEIRLATNNFDEDKVIGKGGFGKVYEGELCHSNSEKKSLVALKRLDRKHGQGDPQFWKEIMMLSRYRHENLISLLGYCIEEGEMILIYEHASRGSLERYLHDANLTWTERIRICLDAAKGLNFLHDPNERQQRVLHCDIKSANILLDDNLNAKISDFGLSKMGSAGQQYSVMITNAVGTPGYCDPLYMETYQLTKESDVYSFGVVLFEVLCGRQCVEFCNGQMKSYVPYWKKAYQDKELLEGIVLEDLKKQMAPNSFEMFTKIAYQCLKRLREKRPAMSLVVKRLEKALKVQEPYDLIWRWIPKEYQEIVNAAVDRLVYRSLEELKELLSSGVLVSHGKMLFCLNDKGQHIERIFIQACLNPDEALYVKDDDDDWVNSRFPGGRCFEYNNSGFKARVRGQYLTPQISYTLNLVFRFKYESEVKRCNLLRYKIDGDDEAKVFKIYPSTHMIEDGWFVVPLYQFTSQHKTAYLQLEFLYRTTNLLVAGIEFQPSKVKVGLMLEEYQHIIEASSQSLAYESLQELKQILSVGIHLNDYKTWFSLNEKGEHCHMISIKDCLIPNEDFTPKYGSYWQSRFPTGLYQTYRNRFKTHLKTELLSPFITYTVNLVFTCYDREEEYIIITYSLKGVTTLTAVNLAERRKIDSYYITELCQFNSDESIVDIKISFEDHGINIQVEGISFDPLEKVEDQVSKKVEIQMSQPRDSNELLS